MLVTQRRVRESGSRPRERRHGLPRHGLLSLGAVVLIALDKARTWVSASRWSSVFSWRVPRCCAFFLVERRRGTQPWCPTVRRNQVFAAACLTVLLMSAIFFAALLYLPQFMQKVLGFSALAAGAGLLPLMASSASRRSWQASSMGVSGQVGVAAGRRCSPWA